MRKVEAVFSLWIPLSSSTPLEIVPHDAHSSISQPSFSSRFSRDRNTSSSSGLWAGSLGPAKREALLYCFPPTLLQSSHTVLNHTKLLTQLLWQQSHCNRSCWGQQLERKAWETELAYWEAGSSGLWWQRLWVRSHTRCLATWGRLWPKRERLG